MDLKPIPLFGLGNAGKSVSVDAQERVNLYAEVDQDSNTLKLYPRPGLTSFVNLGANPNRGVYTRNDSMYVVNGATLWEVSNDGVATSRGTLATSSGRVDMVDNGLQLLIVDGTEGYTFTFSGSTFAQIADADFPACNTCCFLNGYFIVQQASSGKFWLSALYDGTSWAALDFATAEGNPDDLVRVFADNGILWLFGTFTIEPWGDSGAEDFPLARIGTSALEWGLAARWSLCKFNNALMFLGKNRLGAVQVYLMAGTTVIPASNPELDSILSGYDGIENATAYTFSVSGHPMYVISFPSENVSWMYDGLTKGWSRVSSADGRIRGEIQASFLDAPYVSDYENGKVYLIDKDSFTDDGELIAREWTGKHLTNGNLMTVAQLWLEMEPGVGTQTGQGTDPQIMLQVSRDGGQTFGNELWRSIGAVGKYKARAVWNRLGRARNWVFRFRVTDPVKTIFIAAWGKLNG